MIKLKVKNVGNIEVFCKFCERATPLSVDGKLVCEKYGVVAEDYHCRRFVYDPLKRSPRLNPLIQDKIDACEEEADEAESAD